ncbi:hypothetical protein DSC45_11790 [Streptomyces sp. YIM 130001]|nr:hypothetical protein DSC45_11790 [Streptomyces sp. YIM 130001]
MDALAPRASPFHGTIWPGVFDSVAVLCHGCYRKP